MRNILLEKYLEVTKGVEIHDWFTYDLRGSLDAFRIRDLCVHQYAWAIPNKAAIDTLVKYSPIVEIGAGTGYWAALVESAGGSVIAYDKYPPKGTTEKNYYHKNQDTYFHVRSGSYSKAALHPDRTLFMCWPPYDDSLAFQTLRDYTGNTFIFVGEGEGGCTGNDEFFSKLNREWVIEEEIALPQWYGIHDRMTVYSRAT